MSRARFARGWRTVGRDGGLILGPTHHVQLDTPAGEFLGDDPRHYPLTDCLVEEKRTRCSTSSDHTGGRARPCFTRGNPVASRRRLVHTIAPRGKAVLTGRQAVVFWAAAIGDPGDPAGGGNLPRRGPAIAGPAMGIRLDPITGLPAQIETRLGSAPRQWLAGPVRSDGPQ